MISRRRFLAVSGVAVLVVPLAAAAQQTAKVPRIGVLSGSFSRDDDPCLDRLRRGFAELGYIEGRTLVLEPRWSGGRAEPFTQLATELVRLNVDAIISLTSLAHPAVRQATSAIPIVMAVSSFPVEVGLIASLARPGNNVTGIATFTGELFGKRVQLLREAVPGVSRLAVLRLDGGTQEQYVKALEDASAQLGIRLQFMTVRKPVDLGDAFEKAVRGGAQAIMTSQGPLFGRTLAKTAELALRHRLPSFSGEDRAVDAGILMSYGPALLDGCQRAAVYVDRILKGARPADLPVEQPTKFELVLNLKTAKALGLTIPPSLLLRADRVIE